MFWFFKENKISKCCKVSLCGHGIPEKVFLNIDNVFIHILSKDYKNIHEIEISAGYDKAAVVPEYVSN